MSTECALVTLLQYVTCHNIMLLKQPVGDNWLYSVEPSYLLPVSSFNASTNVFVLFLSQKIALFDRLFKFHFHGQLIKINNLCSLNEAVQLFFLMLQSPLQVQRAKRTYRHRYSAQWNKDPSLKGSMIRIVVIELVCFIGRSTYLYLGKCNRDHKCKQC